MDNIFNDGYLEEILPAVRKAAGDTLFFLRSAQKTKAVIWMPLSNTKNWFKVRSGSGLVDLVDIELFSDKDIVNELIALAKE